MNDIFGKYGKIENIELLENKIEGFVTFETDWSAMQAFLTEKTIAVEIAYSWKQPKPKLCSTRDDYQEAESVDESPFENLNDDCIREIFDRCDNKSLVNLAETCKKFENVQKVHSYENIDKTFSVSFTVNTCSMTPAIAHKMVKLMGHCFDTLDFKFIFSRKEISIYADMIKCFMQQAAKYCTNIRKMTLDFAAIKASIIKPISSTTFPNMRMLVLGGFFDKPFDVDLIQSPNLKVLELYEFCEIRFSKPWPSLEKLKWNCTTFVAYDKKYYKFFEQNPQLKRLKFVHVGGNFDGLFNRLPNIEKLTINLSSDNFDTLIHLKNLKKMNKLTLEGIFGEELIGVVAFMPLLKNLDKLKIVFSELIINKADDEIIEQIVTILNKCPNVDTLKLKGLELTHENISYLKHFVPRLIIMS